MRVRLISDLHGESNTHIKLARRVEHSIQLGDLGFNYGYLPILDSEKHKVLGGNHDDYSKLPDYPHYLGDFGTVWDDIFFVRGAWSIDKAYRKENVSWWAAEELTVEQGYAAYDAYVAAKPKIVITHDCPQFLTNYMYGWTAQRSRTGQLLEAMFEAHKPALHVFGHHHRNQDWDIQGCLFKCIKDGGGYYDIETEDWTQ